MARRRCRNRADAEDVVAEAIVRCVTHPGVDPARLPAMLTATTVRLCVDLLRARIVAERNAPRLFTRPADSSDEVCDAMWLAVQTSRLGEMEQAALLARALGLSVAETAELLDVTYRAAEGLLGRARRKMRAAWARTLGLLWPCKTRIRRARGMHILWLACALLTTATVAARPWRPARRPVIEERAQTVRAGGTGETEPGVSAAAPPARLHRVPNGAPTVSRSAPTLTTPDVKVGVVHAHPTTVSVDLTDPVGRVKRCVADGVKVEVGEASVRVVCK